MDDREIPRDDPSHPRERMNDVAAELARRAKPSYIKDRAKEAVKYRAVQAKDRTLDSPILLGILGGLATAAIAKLIKNRRIEAEPLFDEGYGFYDTSPLPSEPAPEPRRTEELRERLSSSVESVKGRVGQVKEAVTEKIGGSMHAMREKIPSGAELRQSVSEQNPMILGLGAIALGAALGFLLPVSERERNLVSPYRQQVKDTVQAKVDDLKERVESIPETIEGKILGKTPGTSGGNGGGSTGGTGGIGGAGGPIGGSNMPPTSGGGWPRA
jgi:hypothetical protein